MINLDKKEPQSKEDILKQIKVLNDLLNTLQNSQVSNEDTISVIKTKLKELIKEL